jgi:hypothetical protein
MTTDETQYWTLWIPDAGATGIWFARARLDPTDTVLAHALPPQLTVEVHDSQGNRVARGSHLAATTDSPIARLRREGDRVTREDIWPVPADYDTPVILSGGEVGRLKQWWHAPDHSAWRWTIELYNHR